MSKAAPPKSKALNVRALVDYIAGPGAGAAGEKVEHRGALNLLNIDHDGQVREMVDLADTVTRTPQPVQHWIISWRSGEQPTPAQADQAVDVFLNEMGLREHQAVYALHRDTDNWHVHVAVNRVHPETEKVVTVNRGFDHEVAHRAIARIERMHGWGREQRGLYAPTSDGRLERIRPRAAGDRQPSARAREFEERTGDLSAESVAIERAAPAIRRARNWRELHSVLADEGMRFEKKGSGALLWIGERAVKASGAGRDCSMSALQKRLGEFEAAKDVLSGAPGRTRSRESGAPLRDTYARARHEHYEDRDRARALVATRQNHELTQLREKLARERREIFRGSWRGKGELLNATRSVLAARHAKEKADLLDRHRFERTGLQRELRRFPAYDEWLTDQSHALGEAWRHRERRPASIEGATLEPPAARDIRAFTAVIDGWRVHYHLAYEVGGPAFTDRGRAIDIFDSERRESILAALQLSAQKWGVFTIHGNEQFQRTCVELAAEHGFKIVNPDLQQAIAVGRDRLRRAKPIEEAEPAVDVDRQLTTPAAIYRRHMAAILREQPGRHEDPSRLDAEIAVRLRITEHSREQIAAAIAQGARALRPDENRDWMEYGRRAATFAFGTPGEARWEGLRDQADRLIRLEGREHERDLLRRLGGPLGRG